MYHMTSDIEGASSEKEEMPCWEHTCSELESLCRRIIWGTTWLPAGVIECFDQRVELILILSASQATTIDSNHRIRDVSTAFRGETSSHRHVDSRRLRNNVGSVAIFLELRSTVVDKGILID